MRILIISQPEVINKVGGAITVFLSMCDLFANAGHEVIGACEAEIGQRPRHLNNNARFICIQTPFSESVNNIIGAEKPDLIIFYFVDFYINAKLDSIFDNIPRILMFHSRPDAYLSRSLTRKLRKVYINTTAQVLFDNYRQLLPSFIRNKDVITIPNAVSIPQKFTNLEIEHKKIIYYSRVDQWKGCELLIPAFARIANKYPDWSVDVYGQYSDLYYKKLCGLIELFGIKEQFHLCGLAKDKETVFLDYDFCVFPSLFEGFSVGLAETLSYGVPCIGFNNASGVNEIIEDGKNGILCECSDESLSSEMERLILNKDLRIAMGLQARKSMEQYDKSLIDKQWLDFIQNRINKKEHKILPITTINKQGKINYKLCNQYNVKRFKFVYETHPGLYWTGICLRDDFSFSIKVLVKRLYYSLTNHKKINYCDIPIIIYNRNEIRNLKRLIQALERRAYSNIFIIDDASTDPKTLDYYNTLKYHVFLQKEEKGFRQLWDSSQIYEHFGKGYYIYTRSDFEIKDSYPRNFVDILLKNLTKFPTCDRIGIKTERTGPTMEESIFANLFRAFIGDQFTLYAPFSSGVKDYGHFNLEIDDYFR